MQQQQQQGGGRGDWSSHRPTTPWQFEKKLSINTIIEILGLAVVLGGPMMVWGRAMEGRVLTIETVQDERKRIDSEYRTAITNKLDKVSEDMNRLQVQVGILSTQISALASPPRGR
jgi:hypothetical protein